ncbi:MAG: ribonuclease R [Caldicoprobacterales bacterium]|nr:ribonuclease R [Clostridiales bacterium]
MDIKEKILDILREKNTPPLFPDQIMEILEISQQDRYLFFNILDDMVEDGKLVMTRKKKYALPETLGYLVGRLQGNAKGFAFFIPDNNEEDDVFIPAENLNSAMHNDRVMIRILKNGHNIARSREGEVYKVLSRANKTVVGTLEKDKHFGFVIPDDPRISNDIFISKDNMQGAETGHKVVVEILKWPDLRRNPEGRIVEILGHKDEAGTDVLSIIRQFNLPEEFPEEVIAVAKKLPQSVSKDDIAKRKDLRHLKTFTIDGADAKDLDDAISIERMDNGNFKLGVHIADVNHYVFADSPIDKEAYTRGTSVYLVDRVVPMLPKELSNGICSLNPDEDRLTMSVIMEINRQGKVVNFTIDETVIRSRKRMIYEEVTKILEEKDPELMAEYEGFIEELEMARELCQILNARRSERGSIDFNLVETQIILDENGKPVDIRPLERGISNRMIEEFMLVCNETIAEYMYWQELPFMYRIHEDPDIEKMLDFNEFIHNFGYHLKGIGDGVHPKVLQELLEEVKGKPEEGIISAVMLRSLQKARYSHENLGHFGLASKNYCHFTAPIRRYPDLIIHRIIKESIHGKLNKKRIKWLEEMLPGMSEHCSKRERVAEEAERETDDLKKVEFMQDKLGEEFEGIISGVTGYGLYVQLPNTVEGLVRINTIEDDYYVYNEKHYCLIGERTRRIFRLGDSVKVKVVKVDMVMRNIDFMLVEP